MHPFEEALSVTTEELEFQLRFGRLLPWAEFILNPRRLRGSDFLMRWSQGVWSERRLVQAVAEVKDYFAVAYGPSGTAPEGDVRAHELYFERLENAGLGELKRPDLLVFRRSETDFVTAFIASIGGETELPFTPECDLQPLLSRAIVGIECENSLWIAHQMPDYGAELKAQKRLDGRPGLKKTAIVPTVILKEQDREPLGRWQTDTGVPLHIWHVFYDLAFGISLAAADQLIREGLIEPTVQTFQAPSGPTTKKIIYKIWYQYAYPLAVALEEPRLVAEHLADKNGHILPYVRFEGGNMKLDDTVLRMLDRTARERNL